MREKSSINCKNIRNLIKKAPSLPLKYLYCTFNRIIILFSLVCTFSFFFFHLLDILYEVPVGIIVLLSIFYGSISIIAVIGNSLVIWIVATTRQMQTVTNLFIANLALADVVIGMFVIPFQVF